MELIRSAAHDSPARVDAPARPPLRVGLVQHHWRPDPAELREVLLGGIAQAAGAGAEVVFLPELTLSRYPAFEEPAGRPVDLAEDLLTGPTVALAAEAARRHGILVHASLYENVDLGDGLGFNTAVLVDRTGTVVGRTRKTHIPVTEGYVEDRYFRPGPADDAYPVHQLPGAKVGLPTCWDEWFPEVARCYALKGADILAYPTAIGSEPDHPDFDTQPLWQQVIVGHAIANGLFIVVPNRTGDEGRITFYGSSFIVDPYGRILARAPRDSEAVLVADLDLDQRRDWLTLFPFLRTRRPDTYGGLS
ncbi:hydrolase [Actinoplanes philippinensis]|uniref:N-carbamoylputrescine amidase n=1 Tax=Actinoplanes philippinensis TaxID=35752 RepID=A0A1I2GDY2_9ACTN|nr:nitrilase-related carbon-nitrogen hydrolase [Actinoplanes philippinensis]GIE76846.1 hydrolase [Actinoplanes philippinensis]SFF15408.1 N-carbamoylputrescine amidase [Actinoplanes philippinensis]